MHENPSVPTPSVWRWSSVVILALLAVLGGIALLISSFATIMSSDGCGTSSGGDSIGSCIARVSVAFSVPWIAWLTGLVIGIVGLVRSWRSGARAGLWGPIAVAVTVLGFAVAAVILFVI